MEYNKVITKNEYKWAVYLSIMLMIIAACYLIIVDQLVLTTYSVQWNDLTMFQLIWTVGPAVICVLYALILLVCYRPNTSYMVYSATCERGNGYMGDKFKWM